MKNSSTTSAKVQPVKLTPATVTDRAQLREAILAVRQQGWAWIDGELDESICGLAIPVRDRSSTVAALNVSLQSGEFTQAEALQNYIGELRVAASHLRAASDR